MVAGIVAPDTTARTATSTTAMATARTTATPKTLLLTPGYGVRMVGLLEHLRVFELILVFPRDVSSDRVVPGERPRTVRTRHPDTLVTLPYVSAQIRLVTVQSFAERTLEFSTCKEKNLHLCKSIVYKTRLKLSCTNYVRIFFTLFVCK